MHIALLLLLVLSVTCVVYGLWLGYRGQSPGQANDGGDTNLLDEELQIFDKVSAGLSQLPRVEDPKALQEAQAEVMRKVGEQSNLSATEVESIYWRVWRWKRGNRR
ncbi:MAG TPA: hypothetical protein VFF51_06505 [Candidatus Methylomirabilis sp.]|nr:hypothetical protein [Candidatus Methylomirabilis sp.]